MRLALDLVDPEVDPVTAGLLHERLGRFLWTADQDGLPDHVRALELVPADPPSAERARVLAGYAQILMLNGAIAASAEVGGRGGRPSPGRWAPARPRATPSTPWARCSIPLGQVDEGLDCLEREPRRSPARSATSTTSPGPTST